MTDEEVFDQIVREKNKDLFGRFDPSGPNSRPELVIVFEEWRKLAKHLLASVGSVVDGVPPIHFDFIDVDEVDAFAARDPNAKRYHIGVSTGTLLILNRLFNRMLADARVLPYIGVAKCESSSLPVEPDIERLTRSDLLIVYPQCSLRRDYVGLLMGAAILHLVEHELTHILNGYVDYSIGYFPRSGNDYTEEHFLTSQTAEWNADSVASCKGIWYHLDLADHPEWAAPEIRSLIHEVRNAARIWAFGVSALSRLFGDRDFSITDIKKYPHPPEAWRRAIVLLTARHAISTKQGEQLACYLDSTLIGSAVEVDQAFALLTGAKREMGGFHEGLMQLGREYMIPLEKHWKEELRGRLDGLNYQKLQD